MFVSMVHHLYVQYVAEDSLLAAGGINFGILTEEQNWWNFIITLYLLQKYHNWQLLDYDKSTLIPPRRL